MTNHDDLHALIASRHPLILAQEQDELRFLGIVRAAAQSLSLAVWTWSATHGLCRDGFDAQYGTKPAPGALERYRKLISSGGSDYPYELVKAAGVDLATPAPYEALVKRMNNIMDEIEAILARRKS